MPKAHALYPSTPVSITATGFEASASKLINDLAQLIVTQRPLVQCLTNIVAAPLSAQILAAIGASPAMADQPEEAGEFALLANAVLVNIGTMSLRQEQAALAAAQSANSAGIPWVLDPVAVGATKVRRQRVEKLIEQKPTVIRGNASEIETLASGIATGRGIDAIDTGNDPVEVARTVAEKTGAIVALSGPTDAVVSPNGRTFSITGGSAAVCDLVGAGCALGAVIAAATAVGTDQNHQVENIAAACSLYKTAAYEAAQLADGPGSFEYFFRDQLAALCRI